MKLAKIDLPCSSQLNSGDEDNMSCFDSPTFRLNPLNSRLKQRMSSLHINSMEPELKELPTQPAKTSRYQELNREKSHLSSAKKLTTMRNSFNRFIVMTEPEPEGAALCLNKPVGIT